MHWERTILVFSFSAISFKQAIVRQYQVRTQRLSGARNQSSREKYRDDIGAENCSLKGKSLQAIVYCNYVNSGGRGATQILEGFATRAIARANLNFV